VAADLHGSVGATPNVRAVLKVAKVRAAQLLQRKQIVQPQKPLPLVLDLDYATTADEARSLKPNAPKFG
jgi:hypothetical protein